jgi:hypothetical protein
MFKKSRNIFQLLVLVSFLSLLNVNQLRAGDKPTYDDLVKYAVSQLLYWSPDYFYYPEGISESLRFLKSPDEIVNNPIKFEIRQSKNQSYFILFPEFSENMFKSRKLGVDFDYEGMMLTGITEIFSDNAYVMGRKISEGKIPFPRNWFEIASRQEKLSDYNLKKLSILLGYFLGDNGISEKQHFFIGPFNKHCAEIRVYWVEGKKMINLANDIDLKPLEIRSVFSKAEELDNPDGDSSPIQNISTLVFSRNNKIANCVRDGFEIITGPGGN